MKCPTCTDTSLLMTDRQGVEIDYCPQCRGVWLDRGELDKLIERSGTVVAAPGGSVSARSRADFADSEHGHAHDGGRGSHGQRKKSWLKDIFD